MKIDSKNIIIGGQIFIMLAFFAGMMFNYFAMLPIVNIGEEARITAEIDEFTCKFYPEADCDVYDKESLDSIMVRYPHPFDGELIIMDGYASIIYSDDGQTGNGYDVVKRKYGEAATNLLNMELLQPKYRSRTVFEKASNCTLYASYLPQRDLLFFYAANYFISGNRLLRAFINLLIFMFIGGIAVVAICFFSISKITSQIRSASIVQQELDTAALIQKSMMPTGKKHLIQLDVNAQLIPAKKVGGDFFCYTLDNGILNFCIGDVSGKGVPAALFMGKAVTLFRSLASSGLTPSGIAARMNSELCINNEQNMFITTFIGAIRVFDGHMTYVNAGHEPPVVWNGIEDSAPRYLESLSENIPLGIMPDSEFEEEEFTMAKNGIILLYTDGVTEAKSEDGNFLGKDGLLNLVDRAKYYDSTKKINTYILDTVKLFEKGIDQSDDISLLTLRNVSEPKHLAITNKVSDLRKIAEFTNEVFKECQMPKSEHILVRSGLDEALTNCVLYAYDKPGQEITVTASILDRRLYFEIRDHGKAFNPLEYRSEPTEELKVGGLGISIYRANFDEVLYRREEDPASNVLTLIKNL